MTTAIIRAADIDVEQVSDDWEELVSAGLTLTGDIDEKRWKIGDLGCKVERRYGSESLTEYGAAINVRKSTIYDYTNCSRLYKNIEDRAAFPPLSWSHYRAAGKTGDRDVALTWLARAADENWSVDQLEAAIKGKPTTGTGKKLVEVGGEFRDCKPNVNDAGDIIDYDVTFRVTKPVELKPRQVYLVKVFAVDESGGDSAASG